MTGASSGIGAATVVLFSKEGANVVMVDRNEEKLKDVAGKCLAVGKKPLVIIADVSIDDDAKRIITDTVATFGKLDILINNAGLSKLGSITDGKVIEAYDVIFKVNVRALIYLTTLAAPHLTKDKGNVVNISSAAAMTTPSMPGFIAYYVSKAAVDHFTRGAALELAPKGIRVNSVNPGPVYKKILDNAGVNTTFDDYPSKTALNRVSQPEEIANMVAYLAGDKAVWITGSSFVVDNGILLKM